jgi:AcrR family transcriptional regulator
MAEEFDDVELPRAVALAWGVAANPQRGPKRELSIERIVEAAVEIADADGLSAVSMSSIAASLGFTTMSLYRYVSAKEDLILLMQEYGTGLPPATIAAAAGWRHGLALWARESLAAYRAHPWLIDIPISGPPNTPNNLAWMDSALAVLEETALTMPQRIGVLLLVTGHTRWQASVIHGDAAAGGAPGERERADALVFSTLVTEEAFPALHRVVAAGGLADGDEAEQFLFGLDRILDGVQHFIDSGAATGGPQRVTLQEPASYPRDEAVKAARQARREAETKLREAQKREREAVKKAVEREKNAAEKERARAAKG